MSFLRNASVAGFAIDQARWPAMHALERGALQHPAFLALQKFEEAYRVTNALVTRYPDYADAVLAHARSESWLGYASQQQGNYAEAVKRFQRDSVLFTG